MSRQTEVRDSTLSVRINGPERELFEAAAEADHRPVTSYVRAKAKEAAIRELDEKDRADRTAA